MPKPDPVEPSMEEIVASISRIIDEDNASARRARAGSAGRMPVLELTEAIGADGSVHDLAAGPSAAAPRPTETPLLLEATAEPAPTRAQPAPEAASPDCRESLVSAATSDAIASAFVRLGGISRAGGEPGQPGGNGGRSLEAIFRDALRPLLQAWLDEHLPSLVERLVREEIQRIAAQAGLR